MVKLTIRKEIVLWALARWKYECPPDGPELSEIIGNPREWATPILTGLEKDGYVERLGKSVNNAWCWRITDLGRQALSEQKEERG